MPSTSTKLTAIEKQTWLAYCQSQGLSESNMLRKLICAAVDPTLAPILKTPKSDKLTLRLKPADFQAMTERAQQEGFPSRTNWATQVLLATLYQLPVFTEAEINALESANRELAAIGRNLNQIAKVLNSEKRVQDQITLESIHTLTKKIEQHHRQTTALLRKGQHRW